MSDIVIKGIEMPKDKPLNLSIYPNGEVVLFCIKGRDVYDNECNYGDYKHKKIAVELPEHGRLGDLDLLKEDFDASLRATRQLVDLDSDSPFYGLQQRDLANAEKLVNGLIDRTPTVLEASEVKE